MGRARNRAQEKRTKEPAGHRQVGCATLSFYDALGERLDNGAHGADAGVEEGGRSSRCARPRSHQCEPVRTCGWLKITDGAKDNWTYLIEELPERDEVVDYYHAVNHLKRLRCSLR